MSIGKICEYLNDIGILRLDKINDFLIIYKQLYQNKFKNESEKLTLSLFSFLTSISKNEKLLYEISKNIIKCFSSNLILYRYRSLNVLIIILNSKLHSRYISFLFKLNFFIFNKQKNQIPKTRKGTIIKKILKRNNSLEHKNDDIECTFSPKINNYFVQKDKNQLNQKINNSDIISSDSGGYGYFTENFIKNHIGFKTSSNYGHNNKINDSINKMVKDYEKFNLSPKYDKYNPIKTNIDSMNQISPVNYMHPYTEYNESKITKNNNLNNYFDDYDFYEKEKAHIKKVQEKIFQLKVQKLDDISKKCTFSPKINNFPKYLNFNKKLHINYSQDFKNKYNYKSNNTKRIKTDDGLIDDNYNIYKEKKKPKKPRSTSDSRSKKNPYSIYDERKRELQNLFNEQYPFVPNITYNKKYEVKIPFKERQEKLIEDRREAFKKRKEEELKQIEDLQIVKQNYKLNTKDLLDRLYEKDYKQKKEQLKKEEEEKSKKKKIIDWDKKHKQYKNKYPDDFKNNRIKKVGEGKNDEKNIIDFSSFQKNNATKDKSSNKKIVKNQNQNQINKEENDKKNNNFIEKLKDEHVIGFKQKGKKVNKKKDEKKDEKKEEKKEIKNMDEKKEENINSRESKLDNNNLRLSDDFNFEEKEKKFDEKHNLLEGLKERQEIKSVTIQNMINNMNKK